MGQCCQTDHLMEPGSRSPVPVNECNGDISTVIGRLSGFCPGCQSSTLYFRLSALAKFPG
jgi:hypothetical protein